MEKEFEALIRKIAAYNPEEVEFIKKAYFFARKCHEGQYRKSGEPYIIHPIAVADILADMLADRNTLCAGLLHDVIEDCHVTREEIEREFNSKIAELVDGVTNLSKADFQNKTERSFGTKRKIILGIINDTRIVVIKLADRLHNMNTLQFQSRDKQKEKAEETLQFYVPLARYIGAEKIRRKLEDLSLLYLDPTGYRETEAQLTEYLDRKNSSVDKMMESIHNSMNEAHLNGTIAFRVKNLYSVYLKIKANEYIYNIHDLLAIKVLLQEIRDCYYALGVIHHLYAPCNSTFKDYICRPKPNMYSSLHSSVIGDDDTLTQIQIRTYEMEKINMQGITAYWGMYKGEAGDKMKEILRDRFKFDQSVKRLNNVFADSEFFVTNVERNILGENINVYDYDGYLISLPEGSTVVDFAYYLGSAVAEKMVGAFVNGNPVDFGTVLHNGDRVHILTSRDKHGPNVNWLDKATNIETQRQILKKIRN